jgi:hypothetical protein
MDSGLSRVFVPNQLKVIDVTCGVTIWQRLGLSLVYANESLTKRTQEAAPKRQPSIGESDSGFHNSSLILRGKALARLEDRLCYVTAKSVAHVP